VQSSGANAGPRSGENEERIMKARTPSIVGAAVGLAVYLPLGLLPSLVYGGYAGVLLASGIFGAPIPSHLAARALVVFGMVFGVTAAAALFVVLGAAAGAAVAVLVRTTTPEPPPAPAPATEKRPS
jgi:hypothetical protein